MGISILLLWRKVYWNSVKGMTIGSTIAAYPELSLQ